MKDLSIQVLVFWLHYSKGLMLTSLQKYSEAIESLDIAIDYESYTKFSCYNESLALNELDKHQRIIKTFAKEIDSKFINSTDYINKSTITSQQKNYQQVVSICSSVLYTSDVCYQLQNINFRQLFNFTDDKAAIGYKPDLGYAY